VHRHISACSTPPPRSSIHRPGAGSPPLRCAWPGVYLTPSHTDLSEQWPRDEHRRGWPLNVLWSVPRRLRQLLPATTGRHAHANVVDGKRQATILPQGALVTEAGARGFGGSWEVGSLAALVVVPHGALVQDHLAYVAVLVLHILVAGPDLQGASAELPHAPCIIDRGVPPSRLHPA